jgi:hypothetical protein
VITLLLFALLGIIGWALAGPHPTSLEYQDALKDQRARSRDAAQAARTARQALRRRIFGTHPVLYPALLWLSLVLLIGLLTVL